MPEKKQPEKRSREEHAHQPEGFTPRSGGLASEYAREQGWGTNQDERTKTPTEKQNYDGGTDYDYGARDFGDTPIDTSSAKPPAKHEPRQTRAKKKRAA